MNLTLWVGRLAAVVLLAGLAELLMPEGRLKGYARAVLGLVVLVAVLRPVLDLTRTRLDWSAAATPPPPNSLTTEAAATRDVFRQLLVDQIVRLALSVAGVKDASAAVDLGNGVPPTVVGVHVRVVAARTPLSAPAGRRGRPAAGSGSVGGGGQAGTEGGAAPRVDCTGGPGCAAGETSGAAPGTAGAGLSGENLAATVAGTVASALGLAPQQVTVEVQPS